jgi:hypothetical protein
MRAGGIFHGNGHARPRELYKIVKHLGRESRIPVSFRMNVDPVRDIQGSSPLSSSALLLK